MVQISAKKSHVCRLCAGTLFAGLLLLTGLFQEAKLGAAMTLAPEPLLSNTVEISTSHSIYLPLIWVTDTTISDKGFEEGGTTWQAYSLNGQDLILPSSQLPVPPNSGQWAARLGGIDNEISMLSQTIAIQKENTCLTYQVWIQSADSCEVDFGGVGVNGIWFMVEPLCAGTTTGRWVPRHVDMEARVSTALTPTLVLNFAAITDYSVASTMIVDDIAFQGNSQCDDSTESFRMVRNIDHLIGQPIDDPTALRVEE